MSNRPTFPNDPDPDLFDPRYLVTLDEIYHSHWAARKRRRMQFLRGAAAHFWPDGHPSRLLHVTGTNGKGSVVYYLEQGLRFDGNTGSWTGPHVFDYAERFHINGETVGHAEIVDIYREVLMPYQEEFILRTSGESLSFAELGILIALHLFDRHKVKWGILEVGAGGRYTPLMALDMTACLLTNVGNDHPRTLGTELWQRALEKAGIARPGVPFFSSAAEPALYYVRKTVEAEQAPFFQVLPHDIDEVTKQVGKLPEFKLWNIALAVKVIRYFFPDYSIDPQRMTGHLPARFWQLAPNIVADVAHNADKVLRLAEQLKHKYPGRTFRFLIGLTRSRNVREVFAPILDLAESIVVTGASYAGQDPRELAGQLEADFPSVEVIDDPAAAFEKERENLTGEKILVLTGSAYMIDQAINPNPYIKHLNADFGRRVAPSQQ